jgi:diguanylate cyclase (GGDEF)-like protein
MISLRKSMNELEALDALFRAALRCYVAALQDSEDYAVSVHPAVVSDYKERLRNIRRSLAERPAPETLDCARASYEEAVKEFSAGANKYFRSKEREIKEILQVLASAAESLSARSDAHSREFHALANEMESAVLVDDLTMIRRRIGIGILKLKASFESMSHEHRSAIADMERRLQSFQHRLEVAEALASADPLTGCANRREAERIIARRVSAGLPLCVMLFDLDGFKKINDHYGHYVGDQVLRAFSKRLAGQFRSDDVVSRWGGDEFLVVMSGAPEDLDARADRVAEKMRGLYAIQGPSGPLNVHLSACVGVAQHCPGESGDELFARADSFLYQNKRTLTLR